MYCHRSRSSLVVSAHQHFCLSCSTLIADRKLLNLNLYEAINIRPLGSLSIFTMHIAITSSVSTNIPITLSTSTDTAWCFYIQPLLASLNAYQKLHHWSLYAYTVVMTGSKSSINIELPEARFTDMTSSITATISRLENLHVSEQDQQQEINDDRMSPLLRSKYVYVHCAHWLSLLFAQFVVADCSTIHFHHYLKSLFRKWDPLKGFSKG